jgi:hypothetical protein
MLSLPQVGRSDFSLQPELIRDMFIHARPLTAGPTA